MNILSGTKSYLGGNLEHSDDSSLQWREEVSQFFRERNILPLDPTQVMFNGQHYETKEVREELKTWRDAGDFDKVRRYMIPVVKKDLRQIDISDFVIFNFNLEKPTYGTMHELVVANSEKKPIFAAVGDKRKTPLWFFGILKPQYIYNSIGEIMAILDEIDSGKRSIDSDRWHLLKEEYR